MVALDGAVTASAESDLPAAQGVLEELLSPLSALAQPVAVTWAVASPQALPLTHMDPLQPVPFASDSALLREIDLADWTQALEAGPGLTAFELRQLGGAFAVPASYGGALDHLTAPLLYHGVGLAGEETARDLKAVRAAIQPFLTGYMAPNFVDYFGQRQRTHDNRTRVHVERVRLAVDPTGLFTGDAAPTRD